MHRRHSIGCFQIAAHSFRLIATLRSNPWPSRYLVILLTIGVLTMLRGILVKVAILMVVSLRGELIHLLRACSKLIWSVISSHRHCGIVSRNRKTEECAYFVRDLAVVRN